MSQSPFDLSANPYLAPANAASPASDPNGGQAVTAPTVELLRQTRPWARVSSVLTFLWSTLMLVGGSIGAVFFIANNNVALAPIMLVYVVLGLLGMPPAIYLFRYASRIKLLESSSSMARLEDALEAQKSFWKFAGIVTAAVLILYAVMLMFVVVGIGFSAFARR